MHRPQKKLCSHGNTLTTIARKGLLVMNASENTEVTNPTGEEILNLLMDPETNDAGASSVREYLCKLLLELWDKEECFSGKRPFGNSGWQLDVYVPLAEAGLIDGEVDEETGEVYEMDEEEGRAVIARAIRALLL